MRLLVSLGLRRASQWQRLTLLDHLLLSPLTFITIQLYHLLVWLRGRPFRPPRGKAPVRVVCISDTHDLTVHVPDGDILVHAGDLTNDGTAADVQKQLDWLRGFAHPVKIVVAGNHDSYFDPRSRRQEDVRAKAKVQLGDILFLQGDMTVQEVNGRKISIFGAGDVPECGPTEFAFQYTPVTQPWYNRIPPQTDILVTHTPPKHHLDLDLGCPHLLREVWRVKPRLHIFGHCHWAYGQEAIYFDEMQAAYETLLSRPRRGPILDFIPNRSWIYMWKVVYYGVQGVAWKWLMGGPRSNQGSIMVNAAQMVGDTGRIKSRAVVVDI
ncbi:Metallophosphoesterase domain protein [Cordyceps fumosorosea ARSEF 2679]|uniref:Metallophosphoesterase domain protein n=1 Tax=Cordyceps fumosorosea (strain ARSEF 2679) TaxID=1081104 RepID=A0A167V7Y1_CORFA|nr:Metallophosphoesterase domain protein [Cordyceps fumosorosea ARSEF 2679]OAA62326.1 Metallophosphoesterase domain protein [Cordyceps fumosorosea ARSEF 2679]